jgi:hypothetical protein
LQLFAVALLDACKFLYDVPPLNCDWADVTHFDRRRLNEMECELLDALNFNLNVAPEDVAATLDRIAEHSRCASVLNIQLRVSPVIWLAYVVAWQGRTGLEKRSVHGARRMATSSDFSRIVSCATAASSTCV